MKKRIIALTLALVMLATLVACSSKEETGDTTLENTEITVAITSHPNWPYREDWASWKYVKEATGANINLLVYPLTEFATKLTLMIADPENIPDLVLLDSVPSDAKKMQVQGAILPIDDYIDFMPNYKKFWDSVPEDVAESLQVPRKLDDGKVYASPVYGRHESINLKSWLYRKDLFEKHNIKTPETMDELYAVAKQLKSIYPDSYPIGIRNFFGVGADVIGPEWKKNFSIGAYYDFDNEKWCYGAKEDVMLDMIKFFIKLDKEGLIVPNYVNIQGGEFSELVYTNKIFVFPQYQVQIDILNNRCRPANPEFTIAAMAPPVANKETGHNKLAKQNVDPCGYVVCNTKDDKRIENTFRFLDWFYSDEACELLSWGKEGETYEVVDGEKKFILEDGKNVQTLYGLQTNSLIVRIEPEAVAAGFSEEQKESTEFILKNTEKEYNPANWIAFTDEEQKVLEATGTELLMYSQEMISKFLLGKEPLSKWDEFVSTIDKIGVDELLAVYETAYNRVK